MTNPETVQRSLRRELGDEIAWIILEMTDEQVAGALLHEEGLTTDEVDERMRRIERRARRSCEEAENASTAVEASVEAR